MKTYVLNVSRFAVAAITTGWTATAFTADLHRDAAAAPPSQWATGHTNQLARVAVPARSHAPLTITSPAFKDGGDIPRENTQYGANIFPGLGWSKGPQGTKSYVVIVQGDAISGSTTSIHLTLFNVPASVTKLGAGMAAAPSRAMYGPNVHGLNQPYAGPHPHTAARQAGRWLFVANEASNSVSLFNIDPASGRLSATAESLSIPKPVTIAFYARKQQ